MDFLISLMASSDSMNDVSTRASNTVEAPNGISLNRLSIIFRVWFFR